MDGCLKSMYQCKCVFEEKERRSSERREREKPRILTRGQRAKQGNSAQMLTDYYHNHLFQMVWRQRWGFSADMCVFSCFTIFQFEMF